MATKKRDNAILPIKEGCKMIRCTWRKSKDIDYKSLFEKKRNNEIGMIDVAKIMGVHLTTAYRRYKYYIATGKTNEIIITNETRKKADKQFNDYYKQLINTCYGYIDEIRRYELDFDEFLSVASYLYYRLCLVGAVKHFTPKYKKCVLYAFYKCRSEKYKIKKREIKLDLNKEVKNEFTRL